MIFPGDIISKKEGLYRTGDVKSIVFLVGNGEEGTGNSDYFSSFLIRLVIILLSSRSREIIISTSFFSHKPI